MASRNRPAGRTRWGRWAKLVLFLVALPGVPRVNGAEKPAAAKSPAPNEDPARRPRPALPPGAVEVLPTDDSTVKLTLREEPIELTTRFGTFRIPIGEVQK